MGSREHCVQRISHSSETCAGGPLISPSHRSVFFLFNCVDQKTKQNNKKKNPKK